MQCRGINIDPNIMKEVLKQINKDRISSELIYNIIRDKGWDFKRKELYLISKLRIEFEDPEFWYYLGLFFFENYELDKSQDIFLENALYCFNKPFENNKNKGKTILCDAFDNPKDIFSLSYSEYIEFLNESLDHLIVIYNKPCFYEGFSLLEVIPKKPEIVERFEVIITAEYNELIQDKEKIFGERLRQIQFENKLYGILKIYKKIRLSELAKKLDCEQSYLEETLEKLVLEEKINGTIRNQFLTITKLPEDQEIIPIITIKEGQCAICREEIKEESLTCSNCSSKFHKSCFSKWIEKSELCPVCQKELEIFE